MNVYTASFPHLEVKGNWRLKSSELGLGAEFVRAGLSVNTEEWMRNGALPRGFYYVAKWRGIL